MKRDMNLVRLILREVEKVDPTQGPVGIQFRDEGYDDATVFEHVRTIIEAGLLDGTVIDGYPRSGYVPQMAISGLTWVGHDFLANAADDARRKSATEFVTEKAGSIAFDLLAEVLGSLERPRGVRGLSRARSITPRRLNAVVAPVEKVLSVRCWPNFPGERRRALASVGARGDSRSVSAGVGLSGLVTVLTAHCSEQAAKFLLCSLEDTLWCGGLEHM